MAAGKIIPADVVGSLCGDHHHWLHGWLRRKLGCAQVAADLAHDTFVRLISSGREANMLGLSWQLRSQWRLPGGIQKRRLSPAAIDQSAVSWTPLTYW